MTGVTYDISIDDAELVGALDGLETAGRDMSPAMAEIAAYMLLATQERFELGVDPDGDPWIPSQRAIREGGQTLIDEGLLLGSLATDSGPDFAQVGSNLAYAAIHQTGGRAGRNLATTLPQRAYLGIGDDDPVEIRAILIDFFGGAVQ